MSKRVAFHTLGCKLNQAETSTLRAELLGRGYTEVAFGEDAELLIVNTCTVTDTADAECRQMIRRGLKGAPGAAVAVTGCYAQLKPEEIASIEGVKGVFGTPEKMRLVEVAAEMGGWDAPRIFTSDVVNGLPSFTPARTSLPGERSRAYMKLQDGCDYNCSFCTIPLARGRARAMALADIGTELHALAEAGYHEVVLTGINLGEYADDDGYRFIDVLRLIEVVAPPFRVRISSIEPNTLSAEIIEFIAHSNVIVPHVHVPLQSGDAEILKQMRRRYNPAMYERTIKHVRESMPHAGIGIDVIVGFPGETDAHFKNSYEFIERLPFTYLHVFTYSEREGTPASTYAHRIPMHVRKERTARLRTLSLQRQQEFATSQLGTCRTVISDSYNPATATLTGITENNIQVSFTGPESMHRTSQRVTLDTLTPTGAKGWLAT